MFGELEHRQQLQRCFPAWGGQTAWERTRPNVDAHECLLPSPISRTPQLAEETAIVLEAS